MERRDFVKLSLLASTTIVLPFACGSKTDWYPGGQENLFLTARDIDNIRAKIDRYDWAKTRFQVLKKDALGTEEAYYQSHWNGNWRQWTTGQYLKSVALYYRLTGDESNLSQITKHLTEEFKLDQCDEPLYKADKPVNKSMWSYGLSRMNYFWTWDLIKLHPEFASIAGPMKQRLEELKNHYLRYENENIKRLGNTQFWAISTLGVLGFLTHDMKAVDTAINGRFGFKNSLEDKMRDGKFWPEPISYTLHYVSCAMSLLTEASRVNNYEDLYAYQSPSGASFKNLIDGLFELTHPNGLLIANGDSSYGASPDKDNKVKLFDGHNAHLFGGRDERPCNKFELFYSVYKDPKYAWVINKNKERFCEDVEVWGDDTLIHGVALRDEEVPSFVSAKHQGIGHAVLTTVEGTDYWKGEGNVLHVRNGSTIQFHGHDDPFHIDLFVAGRMLYPDWFLSGWDYLAPRASRNNRNKTPIAHYSIGHNTVLVDKKGPDIKRYHLNSRDPEINDITFSEIKKSDRIKSISLEGEIYAGVRQKRTLGITSDYLVEVFECQSDDLHTYDYVLHDFGKLDFEPAIPMEKYDKFLEDYKLAAIDSEATSPNNKSIRDGSKGIVDADWCASFSDDDGKRVHLSFVGEVGTEVFETNTPLIVQGGWDQTPEEVRKMTKPMLIVRRHCRSTKFVVLHQLKNFNEVFDFKVDGNKFIVSSDSFTDEITYTGTHLMCL